MRYQPHIRCNIAYTPWPSAYCPPLTSFYLSNITSFVRPVIPLSANMDTGHLVLFEDCGSILLAVGWLDYIVITSYVSQLVNLLRTRTPMGDLVEQSRLALDSHYAYSIQTAQTHPCCRPTSEKQASANPRPFTEIPVQSLAKPDKRELG